MKQIRAARLPLGYIDTAIGVCVYCAHCRMPCKLLYADVASFWRRSNFRGWKSCEKNDAEAGKMNGEVVCEFDW